MLLLQYNTWLVLIYNARSLIFGSFQVFLYISVHFPLEVLVDNRLVLDVQFDFVVFVVHQVGEAVANGAQENQVVNAVLPKPVVLGYTLLGLQRVSQQAT